MNVISVTPNFNGLTEDVVLTIDHGQQIKGGFYNFVIHAGSAAVVSGVRDVAGNALDVASTRSLAVTAPR